MINHNKWKSQIIGFLTAQTISLFGSSLVQYAIVWYITMTTSSGAMMTISTICGFLPQIVISLFAGVWLDRYNRKKMMMISDGIIAVTTLGLAVLFLLGQRSVWMFFAALLVRSAATGVQTPAVNAVIPQIVPEKYLMKVNGINSTITSLMMLLSPAVSGALLSLAGIEYVLLVDVATAVIGIGIMFVIAIPVHVSTRTHNTQIQDIKAGFAYLKENSMIRRLLLFMITVAILVSPAAFLTPLMVGRSFGMEVWRLTASEMTFSAGAALGGVLIASWGGFRNRMHTTVLAGTLYGSLMILMGCAPTFVIYLIINFLIGTTMPCYSAPITVMLQEKVDPQMHGRVFSLVQLSNSCSLPLGMVLFGPMADYIKIEFLLIGAGIAVAGCCIMVWLTKTFKKTH